MTTEKFRKIIEARAKKRVQGRITMFKQEVGAAAQKLMSLWPYRHPEDIKEMFGVMASKDDSKGWPKELWEYEEAQVEKELFAIMDEMQKALIAAEAPIVEENTKEEEEKTA